MNHEKFGFYGRLKSGFPSQVIVDITEKCNLSCIHCNHKNFKKTPHYRGLELDSKLNTKLITEVREEGLKCTQYLRYTSDGEPLLHKQAYELLSEAITKSGVPVSLTTNGTIVNMEKMKNLINEGLFLIDISLDAYYPSTYAKIRVGGDLSKTTKNIQSMISYRDKTGSKTKIVVSFIEQPQNEDETSHFQRFWEGEGADSIVIRRLHSNAGSLKNVAEDLRIKTAEDVRKPCMYPWERIVLKPDGTLHYCPASWEHEAFIADYKTTSIREAWSGEKYFELRRSHLSNQYDSFPFCGRCPDWSCIRWPDEGRSYANMIADFTNTNECENRKE